MIYHAHHSCSMVLSCAEGQAGWSGASDSGYALLPRKQAAQQDQGAPRSQQHHQPPEVAPALVREWVYGCGWQICTRRLLLLQAPGQAAEPPVGSTGTTSEALPSAAMPAAHPALSATAAAAVEQPHPAAASGMPPASPASALSLPASVQRPWPSPAEHLALQRLVAGRAKQWHPEGGRCVLQAGGCMALLHPGPTVSAGGEEAGGSSGAPAGGMRLQPQVLALPHARSDPGYPQLLRVADSAQLCPSSGRAAPTAAGTSGVRLQLLGRCLSSSIPATFTPTSVMAAGSGIAPGRRSVHVQCVSLSALTGGVLECKVVEESSQGGLPGLPCRPKSWP